jgi:hypothetical protein
MEAPAGIEQQRRPESDKYPPHYFCFPAPYQPTQTSACPGKFTALPRATISAPMLARTPPSNVN